MADPRAIKHDNLGDEPFATFDYDNSTITYDETKQPGNSAAVGKAVTMIGNKSIALVADGDLIVGRLERVEKDGRCRVKYRGHVRLPGGNGATLTVGTPVVGALGAASAKGFVRNAAATAADALKKRGFITDVSDTTSVEIFLGG
jgi:hypothetical protein